MAEPTRWADFAVTLGADILAKEGDESPTAGFLEEARRFGWEVVPTIDARAMPSGPVEDAAFESYWAGFEQRARPALAAGIDAIFLGLHGAMATPSFEDAEGELLTRIRALPGAAALPVFGVLDLHGNVTARMCAQANGLVAYAQESAHGRQGRGDAGRRFVAALPGVGPEAAHELVSRAGHVGAAEDRHASRIRCER